MNLKKMTAIVLAAALTAGTLCGCGNASGVPGAEETGKADTQDSQAASPKETKDVTIWYYWETEGHQQALSKVIEDYNTSQDDCMVTAKYVPFDDFKKQLSIGASAAELPDIVILDSPDHAAYAQMGIFEDISGKFDVDDYYEGTVNSCTIDGTLYGVPFGVNCLALYYNKDLLDAAGVKPPTTWDELKTAAGKLTTDHVTGIAISSVQNEEGTFNFMPWVWSAGASFDEIDSKGGQKALAFLQSLVQEGVMSSECINWTQGDVVNQFMAGNVAMMENGPWQIPTMQSQAKDLNWGVTLLSKDEEYASVLGGENYAVVKGGNVEGAIAFLEYATQDEQVKYLMEHFGYISADKSIAENQFDADSVYQPFVEQLEYARPRGPLADWPSVSDAISLAFNKVITGGATPEEAAKEAQTTIDGIIR